jgi:hypothetical protein
MLLLEVYDELAYYLLLRTQLPRILCYVLSILDLIAEELKNVEVTLLLSIEEAEVGDLCSHLHYMPQLLDVDLPIHSV